MVPTQIFSSFFPPQGFFWQVFSGLRSYRNSFASGYSGLLVFRMSILHVLSLVFLEIQDYNKTFRMFVCLFCIFCMFCTYVACLQNVIVCYILYVRVDIPQPS